MDFSAIMMLSGLIMYNVMELNNNYKIANIMVFKLYDNFRMGTT